jgi:hypothetical protein
MPQANRDSCSLAYVIEQRRHGDIASGSDKVDYQTQPAVNEKDDSSRQHGEEIKHTVILALRRGDVSIRSIISGFPRAKATT